MPDTDGLVEEFRPKASSNRHIDYSCSTCGKQCTRSGLKAKRIQFKELGEHGQTIQTRTVAWVCTDCMLSDPDYQRPPWSAAPGLRDTKIARVPVNFEMPADA